MNRTHVTKSLEHELANPSQENNSRLGEAVALGALSTLLGAACNSLVPVAGAAAAGAVTAGVAYRLTQRQHEPRSLVHVECAVDEVLAARTLPDRAWERWVPWEELVDGDKVPVHSSLPSPAEAGFQPTRLASYVGQEKDWAHPLLDGSRLHVHEYEDGTLVLHRDKVDPALGPARATVHWLAEAPEGNVVGGVLGALGLGALAWWVTT